MKRKTLVLPAVAGLLAPVLAGCGATDGGSTGTGAIVVGTTDRIAASAGAPAPLDPAIGYEAGVWNILRQTVQTLMATPRGGGRPVPEAAESCAFTDRESESYRCTLRAGLTFSDGGAVTADDVKYSIDRVLRIKSANGPAALLDNIDTVETSGTREVVFHLKTPDATFPYKLATPAAGIVPRDQYPANSARSGFQVDGSGPYTMKPEVKSGRVVKIAFTRNPHYRGSYEVRSDDVELDLFPDATAMGRALDDKKIDMMARTIDSDRARRMLEKPEDGVGLTEMPGLAISYLGFDTEDPVVGNKAVRQAIAQTVDRGRIASQVYGTTVEPLYSLIPAGITAHANAFYSTYGEPSTDKAAALLKKAKVRTPVRFTLHYTDDHYGRDTATEFETLKKQLNDSGLFDVTTEGTPWARYRPAELRGDYAVYGMGWFPDFPDPDNYTAPFLDRDNFLGSAYASTEARGLIADSRRQADRAGVAPAFGRLQDIVARDVPVLPIWQGKQYVAAVDGLSGVEWAVDSSADLHLWELGRGTH
ncbi:ABC transporter substrate-binding protein [Streptomyces drozdowiczii]|uniref:ABC transporter substrate-binding protein n=1 Tax=Streptomyces drozdowiczii TaxID=202862 RepID=UPI0031EFD8EB